MNKLIVANWKMNLGLADSIKLAQGYKKLFKKSSNEIVVCPSSFALIDVADTLHESHIALGAQNVFWELKGAYTGEISALSLQEISCQFVIIGHSERRQYLAESCRTVNLKARACLDMGLTPIICVGEDLVKRQSKRHIAFVTGQVKRALVGLRLKAMQELVIAYEPIWAIGTGKIIKPVDAQVMHDAIRQQAVKLLGANAKIRVIYGGSVDDSNSRELLALNEIDGFLVGGASLNAEKFYKIANIAPQK